MTKRARGFTLVELLVVVAIIAILAGLLLPSVLRMSLQNKLVTTEQLILRLSAAQENHKLEHGAYLTDSSKYIVAGGRDYDAQGRLVASGGTHTMVEVLQEYGAGIDKAMVRGNRLQDAFEQDIVCGVLGNSSWPGLTGVQNLTPQEWFVRGFNDGDLVVFSQGAESLKVNAIIFDNRRDTGYTESDLETDEPPFKIKSGSSPKIEPGLRRWANVE